jgi:sterol desaturase/sphingolipid hydroxylase (fatty acid hydroxylase superfamily)
MTGVSLDKGVRYRFLLHAVLCYVLLAMALCFWAWREGTLSKPLWPGFMLLGTLGWTLIEYLLHRGLLHYHTPVAAIQNVIEKLHLGHHWDPLDEAKITVPVYASLPIACALLGLFRLMAGSWEAAALLMTGTIGGYLSYEVVHFRIHRSATRGCLLEWQRANHFSHHYKNQDRCFGVTTPLWDYVFGTGRVKSEAQA